MRSNILTSLCCSVSMAMAIAASTQPLPAQTAGTQKVEAPSTGSYTGVVTGGADATVTLVPALQKGQGFVITDVAGFDISGTETFTIVELRQGQTVIGRMPFKARGERGEPYAYHFYSGIPVRSGIPLVARVVRDGHEDSVSLTISGYFVTAGNSTDAPEIGELNAAASVNERLVAPSLQ